MGSNPVEVQPVASRRDLREFIELPYRLHSNSSVWVPPLRLERRLFLNRRLNAFFKHGNAQEFLARRDGRVIGRITAHYDNAFNRYHGNKWGMFGWLEFEDDPDVVPALLATAEAWLRDHHRDHMIGPMDFTMNDESGVMIEGFERQPMIKQPWHPPYYQRRCEEAGLGKAMDLLMWTLWFGELKEGNEFHPMIHAAAEQSREAGVVIRGMRKRDMEAEVTRFMDVYNEAWGHNWGFVPITEAEVAFQAKNLKPVLDEDWAMIAEKDGEVVGAALTLPDVEQALSRMNGRLFPFGWWHFLRRRKYIDRLRVFALGVKHDYQHVGVAAALYVRHIEVAARVRQKWGEMVWILEVNEPMNRAMEGMGGRVVQLYRIYESAL